MTTIIYPDIIHKKPVPTRYNPNSYRILTEEISEHENVPFWYSHARPLSLYTKPNPNELPVQSSETRNNPHAARKIDMVYTNATTFNAPVGIIKTDNVENEQSQWWDWSQPKAEQYGPAAKNQDEWNKVHESSYRTAYCFAGNGGPYAKKNSRYSANPHHTRTVGIVPATELKPADTELINRKLVEKVSFEHQYDCRTTANYPNRGNRHGAFVIDEVKDPVKPFEQNRAIASAKLTRTASMWNLLHPEEEISDRLSNKSFKHRRPLPQIRQAEKSESAWRNAPYANDFQVD